MRLTDGERDALIAALKTIFVDEGVIRNRLVSWGLFQANDPGLTRLTTVGEVVDWFARNSTEKKLVRLATLTAPNNATLRAWVEANRHLGFMFDADITALWTLLQGSLSVEDVRLRVEVLLHGSQLPEMPARDALAFLSDAESTREEPNALVTLAKDLSSDAAFASIGEWLRSVEASQPDQPPVSPPSSKPPPTKAPSNRPPPGPPNEPPKKPPWAQVIGGVVVLALAAIFFIPRSGHTPASPAEPPDAHGETFGDCVRDTLVARKIEQHDRAAEIGEAFDSLNAVKLSDNIKKDVIQQTYATEVQLAVVRECAATHPSSSIPLAPVINVLDDQGNALDDVRVTALGLVCKTLDRRGCTLPVSRDAAAQGVRFTLARPMYRAAPDLDKAPTESDFQRQVDLHMRPIAPPLTIAVTVASRHVPNMPVTLAIDGSFASAECEAAGTAWVDPRCQTAQTDKDGLVHFYLSPPDGGQLASSPSVDLTLGDETRTCALKSRSGSTFRVEWNSCKLGEATPAPTTKHSCNEATVLARLIAGIPQTPGTSLVHVTVTTDSSGRVTNVQPPDVGATLLNRTVATGGPCTYAFDAK